MTALEQAEAHLAARNIDRALASYTALEPVCTDHDRLSAGRWMCHMLQGSYEQAWRQSDAIRARNHPDPHRFWQGEPIAGKRVLVRCLHGYGDTVMYLRWLPLLNQQAREVLIQAPPEILPLLTRIPGNPHLIPWNPPGATDRHLWDVQIESAELPYLFRATPATLPPPTRFTFPESELHRIRTILGPRTKPRVGLVWTGSNYDPARSVRFSNLQPLLQTQAADFWSLQAKPNNEAWLQFNTAHAHAPHVFYTAGGSHDGLAALAAFASHMDLIITIDTLAAHLSGSLNLPTWVLLKHQADWRWMLHCQDSPWYPTARLFRQPSPGNWAAPIEQICNRLRDWCDEQSA